MRAYNLAQNGGLLSCAFFPERMFLEIFTVIIDEGMSAEYYAKLGAYSTPTG